MAQSQPAAPAIISPREAAHRRPQNMHELLREQDGMKQRLNAVGTRYLTAERATRFALAACNQTPDLLKCTPTSFMGSLMAAHALGLEPNTVKQHCLLLPFRNRKIRRDQNNNVMRDENNRPLYDFWYECQLIIEYRGFNTLYLRNPIVKAIQMEAVFDVDEFEFREGTDAFLRYRKNLESEGTRLRGAFCFLALANDSDSFTVLRRADIERSRARSKAWTDAADRLEEARLVYEKSETPKNKRDLDYAQRRFDETPWQAFLPGMAAKTAAKQHAKISYLGDDVDASNITRAAEIDGLSDAGILDLEALSDPDRAEAVLKDGAGQMPVTRRDEAAGDDDDGAGDESARGAEPAPAQGAAETGQTPANPEPATAEPAKPADTAARPRFAKF